MIDATELAFSEAVRHLEAQDTSLASFRSAAGTVLAAASIGSGFLASTALDRHDGMPWMGWVAIVALVTTVAATLFVLRPLGLKTTVDARTLLTPTWQQLSPDQVVSEFVGFAAGWSQENDGRLSGCRRAMRLAIASTGTTIVAWTLLLAWR